MDFCPTPDGPANHTGSDICVLYKVMTKTTRAKMMPNDKDGNDNERKKERRIKNEKCEINRLTSDYGIKTGSQLFCILFSTIISISE
jgi:hypothetical protein